MAIVLNNVVSSNNTSVMNSNFQKIEDAINDDLLKRNPDEGESNEMLNDLDMNSYKITNVTDGVNPQDAVTVNQVSDFLTATEQFAQDAANSLYALEAKFLGTFASAPTVDNQGGALIDGALYFNSTTDRMYVWNDGGWYDISSSGEVFSSPSEGSVLSNYEVWLADTSSSPTSRLLPASPESAVEVTIRDDKGLAGTNTITIGRNGNTIMGLSEDLTITSNWSWVKLKWLSDLSDWRVIGGGVGAQVVYNPTDMLNFVYPVGAVYLSTSVLNPNLTLGFGSWSRVAEGKFLSGVGSSADINSVNKTITSGDNAGEWEHIQTEAELAAHTHGIQFPVDGSPLEDSVDITSGSTSGHYENGTDSTGSSSAMNVTTPSFGIYVWERTA